MNIPKHVAHWDDERDIGNGIIVMLHLGWSFEQSHEGVRGFDTVTEAREGTRKKCLHRCPADCEECAFHGRKETATTPKRNHGKADF
jgi:hypothetical protein